MRRRTLPFTPFHRAKTPVINSVQKMQMPELTRANFPWILSLDKIKGSVFLWNSATQYHSFRIASLFPIHPWEQGSFFSKAEFKTMILLYQKGWRGPPPWRSSRRRCKAHLFAKTFEGFWISRHLLREGGRDLGFVILFSFKLEMFLNCYCKPHWTTRKGGT